MAIDRYRLPRARDYLRDLGSSPHGHGGRERWHCQFCDEHALSISGRDRISCDNGCVWGVGVIGFEAYRWDCSEEQAARQLGCWINERPAPRATQP